MSMKYDGFGKEGMSMRMKYVIILPIFFILFKMLKMPEIQDFRPLFLAFSINFFVFIKILKYFNEKYEKKY